ncbi:MAG TPA: NPCBM/NEW2 domain-containing protein [Candidatus Angelobacter sp.]|nr:NPCBM/NEW2 domain-containing protein [Candidatus Angelobacter sp.]
MNAHSASKKLSLAFSLALVAGTLAAGAQETFWLNHVDPNMVEFDGNGRARINRSTFNRSMSIGGQSFTNGLGTRASSQLLLDLRGKAQKFSAKVGIDDEISKGSGSVIFKVVGDKKTLWQSPVMHAGDAPREINVSLKGVKQLTLIANDNNDGNEGDDADWVDAKIIAAVEPVAKLSPREPAVILTPKPSRKPRINNAKIFGVRPGHPFLFTIAATGDRPMTFSADGLPDGLQLDPTSGRITGMLNAPGDHIVTLHAKNRRGKAEQKFKIVCGSKIGLTPAMGWNSWNCFASAVTEDKVKAAADAMVKSTLIDHGWTYINIDDYWEVKPSATNDPTLQGPQRDAEGHIIPNPRFPDMKNLTDYVHSKGLKIGLYSSPGPRTCGGCIGSYQHEDQDAQQYADWGFDYLKYDWCSYGQIAREQNGGRRSGYPLEVYQKPYQVMRAALDKAPRDIIFSFCQYGMGDVWKWGAEIGGNSWRTTGDIRDSWGSMSTIGFGQAGHEPYAGPGHFNDPDMLVVGMVGWGPRLHPTHLSPNEQYTHISLWCLLDAPLLIGCDMTQLDPFTLSLLTNDEVLGVDQDPLGRQAGRVSQKGSLEVWAKDMEDGSKAVGLFNRSRTPTTVTANWSDLGLTGKQEVRDLWRQKNLGKFHDKFETTVPGHGVVLVRISPVK